MAVALIVGAGFSRAISDAMPMTLDLGKALRQEDMDPVERDRIPIIQSGEQLERYLSRIAEPQPFLSDIHNAIGAVDFKSAVGKIFSRIEEGQGAALAAEPPSWLRRLCAFLHVYRHDVVTFNYDTLLESAITRTMRDALGRQDILPAFYAQRIPTFGPIEMEFGPIAGFARVPSFRLVKLHGSVDSWWLPGDTTGGTIGRFAPVAWGDDPPCQQTDGDLRPAGREPFIIPPSSSKSAYYSNPIVRQLWRDAADALSQAERVCLLGYSLPLTDLTSVALLEHALGPNLRQIDIVDPFPGDIADRLARIGVDQDAIKEFPEGVGAGWVADLIGDADCTIYPPASL